MYQLTAYDTYHTNLETVSIEYKTVSKPQARKLYEAGHEIVLCASNLAPFGAWSCGMPTQKRWVEETTFDDICSSFAYYNCNSNETGRSIRFWVKSEILTEAAPKLRYQDA